jgi:hypothetical protein
MSAMKSHLEPLDMTLGSTGSRHLKISAPDLARTLLANDLELVGDGESFRVVRKN